MMRGEVWMCPSNQQSRCEEMIGIKFREQDFTISSLFKDLVLWNQKVCLMRLWMKGRLNYVRVCDHMVTKRTD